MSEQGSFATGLVFCDACDSGIDGVLLRHFAYPALRKTEWIGPQEATPGLEPAKARMWSGRVGATYAGGEVHAFGQINDQLQEVICHPLRITVMAENGDNMVFSLLPTKYLEEHPPVETDALSPLKPHNPLLEIEPGRHIEVQATHLGDKLNCIRFVEGLRVVTYSIPLYVDADGKLICDSFTKEIPEEAKAL